MTVFIILYIFFLLVIFMLSSGVLKDIGESAEASADRQFRMDMTKARISLIEDRQKGKVLESKLISECKDSRRIDRYYEIAYGYVAVGGNLDEITVQSFWDEAERPNFLDMLIEHNKKNNESKPV